MLKLSGIQQDSIVDGPGIRTTFFCQGCPHHCPGCHNPETLSFRKQILYIPSKCIHCGKCIELCPQHHKIQGNDMVFLREGCVACGKCASECPSLALSLCGEDMTTDAVFQEISKDIHYFISSGGGVTFSGGECLLHPDFLSSLSGFTGGLASGDSPFIHAITVAYLSNSL